MRNERPDPFIGNLHPLNQTVTVGEVAQAFGCLNNGRASGPNTISDEQFKYAHQ